MVGWGKVIFNEVGVKTTHPERVAIFYLNS